MLYVLMACIGLMCILKYGSILSWPRDVLTSRIEFFEDLFGCSLCLGFWCGVAVGSKPLNTKEQLKGGGVRYITDKMAKDKGLKNADEYIDAHNEIQAEHAKILPPSKQKIIP